jgi:predicted branched-subunit amino acid permease
LAAIAGALFLGVRNGFYGLRLGERLELTRWVRPFAAQTVIDETAAVSLVQPDRRSARLGFTVTGVSIYLVWNATTLAGALGATALGDTSRYGLDVAGPAVFLALLAPRLREGGEERAVALLGALLALAAVPLLPAGVPVLVALGAVPAVARVRGARRRDASGRNAQARPPDPATDPGLDTDPRPGSSQASGAPAATGVGARHKQPPTIGEQPKGHPR